jgi:hypothetical protein
VIEFLVSSQPRVAEFVLSQARREMQRFWMNNQPSVLTYERLNGAIGP